MAGTNRYAYSGNDPVNLRDPGGNETTPGNDDNVANAYSEEVVTVGDFSGSCDVYSESYSGTRKGQRERIGTIYEGFFFEPGLKADTPPITHELSQKILDEMTTIEDSSFFDGLNSFGIGIGKCASSCGTGLEILDDTFNKYSTNAVVRSQVNTVFSKTVTNNPTFTAGRLLGGTVTSGVFASTNVGPSGMLAGPLGAGAAIAGDVGYAVDRARELGVELSFEDVLGIIAPGGQ